MEVAELVLEYVKALVWPTAALTTVLVFRRQIHSILGRLRKADLPGGVALDFDKEVREAKQLSEKVEALPPPAEARNAPTLPLTEANARMIALGLQPSPSGLDMDYYRQIAKSDPNLALAGLRIEIDILAKNLAKGFGIEATRSERGTRLLRKLNQDGAITEDQLNLAFKIWRLSSAAVHGQPVSREEANDLLDAADVLAEQYVSWLSWGFGDGWEHRTS